MKHTNSKEYVSDSSIDKPPREPRMKQEELFDEDEHEQSVEMLLSEAIPDEFEIELKLTLKGCSGNKKPHTIPIVAGKAPADRIEEVIQRNVDSTWFVRKLRAVIGEPLES
jgi:hypothetical protein